MTQVSSPQIPLSVGMGFHLKHACHTKQIFLPQKLLARKSKHSYLVHVVAKLKFLILLAVCGLLCGCSQRIVGPEDASWQPVPCEYRLEGNDESILLVRAQVAQFDSAKIVLHTLSWTVGGDTLSNQVTFYPNQCEWSGSYATFASDRPLPINTVIRSVELFVKIQTTIPRYRYRM